MPIPRLTAVTLGVSDLAKATAFYQAVFGITPNTAYEGVTFYELPGTWLTLYPRDRGYFAAPDGFHWEVVWGPMFEFAADGSLRFRE